MNTTTHSHKDWTDEGGHVNLARIPYAQLTVRVRSTSTIEVRQGIYSEPPTLIRLQVTVRLHHDRLIVYLDSGWVCQLPRVNGSVIHGPRAWCNEMDHLIYGLRVKPRALLQCSCQRQLFPGQPW